MVNSKAAACFSYIPAMLTNALPGAQWIRDMGTRQQDNMLESSKGSRKELVLETTGPLDI